MEHVACLQNGGKKPSKTEPATVVTTTSLKNLTQSEGKFLTGAIVDFQKRRFLMICNAGVLSSERWLTVFNGTEL